MKNALKHIKVNRMIKTGAALAALLFLIPQSALPFLSFFKEEKKAVQEETAPAPAAIPAREESAKIDAILTALNESLEENKKLRVDTESAQDMLNRATIENNVLRSQLRTLQSDAESAKSALSEKEKQAKQDINALSQKIEALKEAEKKSEEFKAFAEETLAVTESENKKLRKLLSQAILESERDEYVKRISESTAKAEYAARQMMQARYQKERMRSELALAYYNLGNMLAGSGQHRSAITQYKKALRLNPNDTWSHYNSAVIYDYHLHKRDKALAHYKRYLQLEPSQKELNKIRERVLEIELKDAITPAKPLKPDFDNYQKELNKPYSVATKR